ncbi:MAG TPA: RsmD family RNA methyltransferase, partial [Terracidiphilus sp.]|nr:RsmD family RNA methyltransferase [Terracidiphilus sp.]
SGVAAFLRRGREAACRDGTGFDVVFLDPPYDAADEYASTLGLLGGAAMGVLAEGAVVIAEHRKKEKLEECYARLERTRLLTQGDAALSFYRLGDEETGAGAGD